METSAAGDDTAYARLLEAVFANSSETIVIVGVDGTISFTSAGVALLLGYDSAATVGRSIFEFVHPDSLDQSADLFERRPSFEGMDYGFEVRLRHSSGEWLPMVVTAAVLPEPAIGSIALTIRAPEAATEIERALRQRVAIGEYCNRLSAELLELSEADDVVACIADALAAATVSNARRSGRGPTSTSRGRPAHPGPIPANSKPCCLTRSSPTIPPCWRRWPCCPTTRSRSACCRPRCSAASGEGSSGW